MSVRYVRLTEVVERLGCDANWVETLEAEGLIHLQRTLEDDVVLSAEDADRVRVILTLVEEMEVNLAGAEVILHMREEMLAMHRQFDEILSTLVAELRKRLNR